MRTVRLSLELAELTAKVDGDELGAIEIAASRHPSRGRR